MLDHTSLTRCAALTVSVSATLSKIAGEMLYALAAVRRVTQRSPARQLLGAQIASREDTQHTQRTAPSIQMKRPS